VPLSPSGGDADGEGSVTRSTALENPVIKNYEVVARDDHNR
jgi:hypothetical protein